MQVASPMNNEYLLRLRLIYGIITLTTRVSAERWHIMNENNKDCEEYDSLKDVIEFQNNMFNPGHYVGTGKVPPTLSAPGNATPWAVVSFFKAVLFLALGLFLFFSDANVTFGLIESDMANKIIVLIMMLVISLFSLILGFAYLKKAKNYYRKKDVLEKEQIDETVEDEILQRICPKCGHSHDIDYPKCPNCKFNYLD